MARRIDKLLPASFKGIPFLVSSEALTEGGRKIVLHDYPDSSQRFVEDLGELPPRFRVQAFVQGENWRERAGSLERALREKGPGKLQLPTFGSITIYALPYSKDASQQSVGIISFSLDFASGKPANAPTGATTTQEEVFQKGDDARRVIQEVFEDAWELPNDIDSILVSEGDIKQFGDSVLKRVRSKIDTESLRNLENKVEEINNSAQNLVRDANELANTIIQGTNDDTGIWQLVSVGFGNTGAIETLIALTNYGIELENSETATDITGAAIGSNGDDETSDVTPYWPETTKNRVDRNAIRRVAVRTQRLNALIAAYEQVAAGSYQTTDDITNARNQVEQAYNNIMLDGTANRDSIQSEQGVRFAVDDVRAASLNVLEQKEQDAFGLVEIDENSSVSQFVLSYKLYAEDFTDSEALTERARVIRSLNPSQNGLSLTNGLTVLQNRVIV